MKKITYKVTGEYGDLLEMKKGNVVLHEGSLIGLISCAHDRLELRLNYGTDKYHVSEIKKAGDKIIITPSETDKLIEGHLYFPLVLTNEEYEELVEVSYIDRYLLNNIQDATMVDIKKILSCIFKNEFNITAKNFCFEELLDNVVAFSKYGEKAMATLEQIANDKTTVLQVQEGAMTRVTMYVAILSNIYEWDSIVYNEGKFFFRIVDDYVVLI